MNGISLTNEDVYISGSSAGKTRFTYIPIAGSAMWIPTQAEAEAMASRLGAMPIPQWNSVWDDKLP